MSPCLKYAVCCCVLFAIGCGSSAEPTETAETSDDSKTETVTAETKTIDKKSKVFISQLLKNAEKFLKNNQPHRAVELISQAIALNPESADSHVLRAQAYAQTGRMADALADYSTAIRVQPTNPRFHNARGMFLMTRIDPRSAFNDLNKAIQLDANYAEPFNNRGLMLVAAGKFKLAIADLTQALKIKPRYLDALNNRGFAYYKMGENEKAIEDFDLALKYNSDYVSPYNNRGLANIQLKKFDEAAADFSEAIKRDPKNPKYYEHRLVAYRLLGKQDLAAKDANAVFVFLRMAKLNEGIVSKPRDPQTWLARARYYFQLKKEKEANLDIQRAIALDPKNGDAFILRAEMHIANENWFKAQQDATKAIQFQPSDKAYSLRGDIHFHNGNYDRAIHDFEQSHRFDSVVAVAYFRHAQELKKAGQIEAADKARKRALAIDPQVATSGNLKTNGN